MRLRASFACCSAPVERVAIIWRCPIKILEIRSKFEPQFTDFLEELRQSQDRNTHPIHL